MTPIKFTYSECVMECLGHLLLELTLKSYLWPLLNKPSLNTVSFKLVKLGPGS